MLPPEIEKTLRKLGPDGEKVRGTLEREFAEYLEEKAPQRKERDLGATTAVLLGGVLKPVVQRFGKQLAEQALDPDKGTFAEALKRSRERQNGARRNGSHPPGGNDTAPL
jgi:hypothetical protein